MDNKLENAIRKNMVTPLEKKPRLSSNTIALLNQQIVNEMYSCNLYKQLSSWLDENGWTNGSKLFLQYGNEEIEHADKVIDYLYDMNCKVIIGTIEQPTIQVNNIRSVLTTALQHEIGVTNQWKAIAIAALKEVDLQTYDLCHWFMYEQIEEETKFRDLLFKLNLGTPDYEIDKIFKKMLG